MQNNILLPQMGCQNIFQYFNLRKQLVYMMNNDCLNRPHDNVSIRYHFNVPPLPFRPSYFNRIGLISSYQPDCQIFRVLIEPTVKRLKHAPKKRMYF